MKTVRWGILGAAKFARDHMGPAIHAAHGAELSALATSDPAKAAVEAFTRSKTKAELLAGAMQRRLLMAPIATPAASARVLGCCSLSYPKKPSTTRS